MFGLLVDGESGIELSKLLNLKVDQNRSILFKADKSILGGVLISISIERNAVVDFVEVGGKLDDSKYDKVKSWRINNVVPRITKAIIKQYPWFGEGSGLD